MWIQVVPYLIIFLLLFLDLLSVFHGLLQNNAQRGRCSFAVGICFCLLDSALFCLCEWARIPFSAHYLFFLGLLLVQLLWVSRQGTMVLFWAALQTVFLLLCSRGLAVSFASLVTGKTINEISMNPSLVNWLTAGGFILAEAVIPFFLWTVRKGWLQLFIKQKKQVRLVTSVCALTLVYQMIAADAFFHELDMDLFSLLYFASCALNLAGYFLVFMRAVRSSVWVSEIWKNQVLAKQLQKQLLHYRSYEKYTDSIRAFRHDYSEMMSGVLRFLQEKDGQGALRLLEQVDHQLQTDVNCHRQYSNHVVADAVLQDLANACQSEDVRFEANLFLPDWLKIPDFDLSQLMIHICNNAAEGCANTPPDVQKYIFIMGGESDGWFTMTAENSFDGQVNLVNGVLLTSKKDKELHGKGLAVIREIAISHGGFTNIEIDKGNLSFKLNIHIGRIE